MISTILKIYYNFKLKIVLYNFKKLINLRNLTKSTSFVRIRKIAGYKNTGHDEENDLDTYYIANYFLKLKNDEAKNTELRKLINACKQDEKLLQIFDLYVKIDNLINNVTEKEKIILDTEPKEPLLKNIEEISIKKIKRVLRKFIKSDFDDIIDRSTFKFNITTQETTSYLTIISTLIFCGGYLYNRILFKLYGIDTSLYFTISDYLSVAIKQIDNAFIGGVFALIGFFISIVELKENIGYFKDEKIQKKNKRKNILFTVFILGAYGVHSYFNHDFFFEFLFIPMLYFFNKIINKFLFPHIKASSRNLSIILFTTVYFTFVVSTAIRDYYVDNNDDNLLLTFKHIENQNEFKEYKLITITSNYAILRKNRDSIKIIEKGLITSFEYINKTKSPVKENPTKKIIDIIKTDTIIKTLPNNVYKK